MPAEKIEAAVEALLAAQRSGAPLKALPEGASSGSIAAAHRVQDVLLARMGEPLSGWKISASNGLMRGAIPASRMHASPAALPAAGLAPYGVEGEIAFELLEALAPRASDYSRDEILDAIRPLAAIEVVSTRFASYADAPPLDRLCDFMSNGALVCGAPRDDWRSVDFGNLPVRLTRNGEIVYDANGGHPGGDPVEWLVAHVNEFRLSTGLDRGTIVTCGTYTGMIFGAPGDRWSVTFDGFEPVEMRFLPS